MNSWGNEQYTMQNMMHAMPNMMPNMMQPGALVPPLLPPFSMMGDMNQMQMTPMPSAVNPPQNNGQFIGPVIPQTGEDVPVSEAVVEANQQSELQDKRHSRDRNERRDRDRERDRGRRRSRSRTRDQKDRGGRNRNEHRERQSKWDNNDRLTQQQQNMQAHNTMIMQGNQMMQYNNMMQNMQNMQNPMMNQPMDMPAMATMNYSGNMMQQMIMMSPTVQMSNQSLYFSNGVILPVLPGTTVPPRRDPLPGCRTIFIGGLPLGITKETVQEIFEKFGAIDEVKLHKQGVCHVRFEKPESVEQAFFISGCRIKFYNQQDSEASTIFIDYALNREDQNEHEKNKRKRSPTPPRVEQFTANSLVAIGEKIKSDNEFAEAAPTLAAWLERGECNKKNANTFYTLIQAANNQLRRLFNEKMQIDDEYQTLRNTIKDKFGHIVTQFEQVAKILTAAKIQRVSDHFSKQQRRNIEMWLKMTEELDNIREEYNTLFDEDETEKVGSKNMVPLEKYEQLKVENENLSYELEGYKNEAHLAKEEAERKFEKFKAHYIAQQALQQNKQNKQVYPPLPPPPMPNLPLDNSAKPQPPPPLPDDQITSSDAVITSSEAKLISLLSAFLMVHPRGATLDYLVSYVKSLTPNVTQSTVLEVLKKYSDVFQRKTTGVGACIEHKWCFSIFDDMKEG
uniref:RRM domain-containing protein n=1 Tax=Heliothis virescens TaxID=7102 RepID=A0A2A4JK90_HELVI